MADTSFDLIVIGAGPGGYHAAIRGAQLGLSVAVVEKDDGTGIGGIGGVCLNWGCIPSKSLLKNAELVSHMNDAEEWGLSFDNFKADMGKAIDRSRKVSARLTQGIGFLFRKNKITLVKGKATLKSSTQVDVEGGDTLTGKNIVIATGARARSLPGLEIDGESIITSRHALELREQPKAIAIVGASAIGCEFAYYYNAYGTEVMMFEVMDHLVPKEDVDVSKELERQFGKQGIQFALGAKVGGVEKNGKRLVISYEEGGESKEFTCDKVMLGVGVQPNTDEIGLEAVGVNTYGPGFIEVDGYMRTNVGGVYAVGDVNGKLPLAHVAFDQGVLAAEMAAGHDAQPIEDYASMPRCTYCNPQIASIGLTEAEAREQGIDVKIGKVPFAVAGKSVAIGDSDGFAKVITDGETGEVVGAHVIGPEATELIAEIGMLKFLEGTNLELHKLTHAHPTLSEAIKEAGAAVTGEAIHF
jgi:dihydrolipoamide dehydrogenase